MDQKYKYCLIKTSNNEINLFNNSELIGDCKKDHYLTDVVVEIKENGLCTINGFEHEFHYTNERIRIEDLPYMPRKGDIKKSKPLFGEPYEYVIGHYAYPHMIPVSFIISNYIIRIVD